MTRAATALAATLVALGAAACGGGGEGAEDDEAGPGAESGELSAARDTVGAAPDTLGAAPAAPDAGGSAPPAGGRPPGGTPAGGAAPPGGGQEAVTVTGTVGLSGTAEMPMLTLRTDGGSWILRGDAEAELRRLDGATVAVTGRAGGDPGRLTPFDVASYELVSVGGETPFVGRLESAGEGLVLVTEGARLRLTGAGDLADEAGARVWVTGRRTGDALAVGSYGVIRPAG